jgi:hypothetical protein
MVRDPALRNEATTRRGQVRLGPKYDLLSPRAQRAVLIHEAAHLAGLDDWFLRTHDDWDLAARTRFGHLNGQTTPGEILAEAFALAWDDPAGLRHHAPTLIPIVREGALASGLPVPPLAIAPPRPRRHRLRSGPAPVGLS